MSEHQRSGRTIHYTELTDLPPDHPLHREWNAYRRELPRLLAEGHAGKFVLIHGDSVVGTFATSPAASMAGAERFGLELYLVQQIREYEPVHRVPSYAA
jgi:hypothetical protein